MDAEKREMARKRTAEYRRKYPEKVRDIQARSRAKMKLDPQKIEKVRGYQLAYRESNRRTLADKERERTFGISAHDYNQMIAAQGNCCAICARPERTKRNGKIKALAVDHNHETGAIRGLLCHDCNTAIGKLYEDRGLFLSAIRYLDRHNGQQKVATLSVVGE